MSEAIQRWANWAENRIPNVLLCAVVTYTGDPRNVSATTCCQTNSLHLAIPNAGVGGVSCAPLSVWDVAYAANLPEGI